MRLSAVIRFAEPRPHRLPGVYVIRRAADGCVKIGMSEDLHGRVGSYGPQVELLHTIRSETPREAERVFHSALKAWRVEGEWFALREEHLEWLRSFDRWPREG